MSNIDAIPHQLCRVLNNCERNLSQIDIFKAFVVQTALECGFAEQSMDTSQLNYTCFYSFDHRIFNSFPTNFQSTRFEFKVVIIPTTIIAVEFYELGDLLLICAYEKSSLTKISQIPSIAIPMSRYVPFKMLIKPKISVSFRHLKELSMKLKELFLPLRNQIFQQNVIPGPFLNGMPEIILKKIYSHLKSSDIKNIRLTCKHQAFVIMKNFLPSV